MEYKKWSGSGIGPGITDLMKELIRKTTFSSGREEDLSSCILLLDNLYKLFELSDE